MLNLAYAALRLFLAIVPCDVRKSFNGPYELSPTEQKWTVFGTSKSWLESVFSEDVGPM